MSETEGQTALTEHERNQLYLDLAEGRNRIDLFSNYTAQEFTVTSAAQMTERNNEMRSIKQDIDTLETCRVALVSPHNNAVREINAEVKVVSEGLNTVFKAMKAGVNAYLNKVEQERIEAERKAREAAAKEQARLQKLADAAREKGKEERAETLEFRAQAVTAAPPPPMPKAAGTSRRTTWTFTVTDPALIPREYLLIDEKKIGAVVRAMKADTNIPGISVRSETDLSVRGG